MPGPVSDSYDPEFGTGANAADVAAEVRAIVAEVTKELGEERRNILEVVHGPEGRWFSMGLSEKSLRVLRFALERALEDL